MNSKQICQPITVLQNADDGNIRFLSAICIDTAKLVKIENRELFQVNNIYKYEWHIGLRLYP